ncbi:MAG: glycosyltransferase [Pseudomonadota bacterium]|nr:glycosyltransferase [Gammaproteobacteria bacterium]
MRIALLSGANSIHTIRWANGLKADGHEVHLFSQHRLGDQLDEGVVLHLFPFQGMLGYFTMVPRIRKIMDNIQPDIVNAHYASGYATTARLVGRKPWLLSVWGSDVYSFPYKTPLHKWLVKGNLMAADAVGSTSHCMGQQVRSLAPELRRLFITPFGVDAQRYGSIEPVRIENQRFLTVGTVKAMSDIYGVDILIHAFALLLNQLSARRPDFLNGLKLRLVGGGEQAGYRYLAAQLGIADKVTFVGRVPHKQVPDELAKLDIYVALSRQESFGVAIIEASAAGLPVVVSDAGGLPEVTLQGKTGLVVPRENPQAAADAIQQLVLDPDLRHRFGVAGRQHVTETYSWPVCVQQMVNVFEQLIEKQID